MLSAVAQSSGKYAYSLREEVAFKLFETWYRVSRYQYAPNAPFHVVYGVHGAYRYQCANFISAFFFCRCPDFWRFQRPLLCRELKKNILLYFWAYNCFIFLLHRRACRRDRGCGGHQPLLKVSGRGGWCQPRSQGSACLHSYRGRRSVA